MGRKRKQLTIAELKGSAYNHQIKCHPSCRLDLFIGVKTRRDGTANGYFRTILYDKNRGPIERKFKNLKNAIKYYNSEGAGL